MLSTENVIALKEKLNEAKARFHLADQKVEQASAKLQTAVWAKERAEQALRAVEAEFSQAIKGAHTYSFIARLFGKDQ